MTNEMTMKQHHRAGIPFTWAELAFHRRTLA
jgi:hypothetical protein